MRSKSLNIRVPRLGVNRFGVYYVRSSVTDHATGLRKVAQQSLGTKSSALAKVLALKFCLNLVYEDLMSDWRKHNSNYELDATKGIANAKDPEDHARMLEAMAELKALDAQKIQSVMELVKSMGPEYAFQMMMQRNAPPPVVQQLPVASPAFDPVTTQLIANGLAAFPKPTNVGITLRAALDQHLAEEKDRLKSARTASEKEALYNEFAKYFGDSCFLNQITKTDITDGWRLAERKRPSEKVTKEKKAQALLAAGGDEKMVKPITLSLARLEKRRGYLSVFFEWAKAGEMYLHGNPVDQPVAKKKDIRAQTQSYKEFTPAELQLLFGSAYRVDMNKPDWYWVPLMALHSGARLNELASLTVGAFDVVDGIKVFDIESGKTDESRRRVPIHSKLLDLGLWEYVEFLRSKSEKQLFWFRPQKSISKSSGEMWGKWVQRCGINDPGKVFHSFRSTAITAMHNSFVQSPNPAAIRSSVGHAGGLSDVHGSYVRGSKLVLVREAIESLSFPEVSGALLKLEDPKFSEFFEEEKTRLSDPAYLLQQQRRKQRASVVAEREARKARHAESRS
jgi:integrase